MTECGRFDSENAIPKELLSVADEADNICSQSDLLWNSSQVRIDSLPACNFANPSLGSSPTRNGVDGKSMHRNRQFKSVREGLESSI